MTKKLFVERATKLQDAIADYIQIANILNADPIRFDQAFDMTIEMLVESCCGKTDEKIIDKMEDIFYSDVDIVWGDFYDKYLK